MLSTRKLFLLMPRGIFCASLFSFLSLPSLAQAAVQRAEILPILSAELDAKLAKFDANPKEFMHDPKNIAKFDARTGAALAPSSVFSEESIRTGEFILQKDFFQKTSKLHRVEGRAPIYNNDNPANLVDRLAVNTLQAMESNQLTSSQVDVSPWSDDYWPIYTGITAKRYADPGFPFSKNWNQNQWYIMNTSCSIDNLSPAEKYDLLVGDSRWTLTQMMANAGSQYGGGYVQTWMGICHGWAPAAMMYPRPSNAVTVTAADGKTKIRFYPSDIKALASLLWANASPQVRFVGGRCQSKSPAEDQYGRVLTQECFDTNPATWHLSVVNQIGASRRSFLIDATYDYEVWNQPVYGYRYGYFNPQLMQSVGSLQQAAVPVRKFSRDRFRPYRSRNAAYIVGVMMRLVYVKETDPSHALTDSPANDNLVAVDYLYDLELDSSYQIIGGEWYQRAHPDFLWAPEPDARALTAEDARIIKNNLSWKGTEPFPASWTPLASSAAESSRPLALVVESLIGLSQ